ncbi:type IV secretory system conjugative DNA transfer family protein [uncultured Methylobacterium sp.]|uniref:type IV secretory system conjugative DNA transfer family protein n=1 Tax=uncultured Methylobacterium sp. TaxID=157278 RepID=UPI0035CA1DC0
MWIAAVAALAAHPASAQLNPIIAATQAPGYFAGSLYPYGAPPGYGGFAPAPYPGYGSPYPNTNPALNQITQAQNNPNIASRAGATQMSGLTNGGGGGGGSGGGGQSGGSGAPTIGMRDPDTNYELLQDPGSPVYGRYGALRSKNGDIRQQVLAQAARGIGIRQGFAEETARLNAELDGAYGAALDARYDFAPLMIERALVPPGITELHKLGERAGDRLLYLTLGAFEIVRPARLSLAPPNWRDYLYNNGVPPSPPGSASDVAPDGFTEEGVWDAALRSGVAVGIEEARASFSANLNQLERDHAGMDRYHDLARSGAVSLPVVRTASHKVRIGAGGARAFIGERVVTLQVSPRFRAARPAAYR